MINDIPKNQTLILMACSAVKRPVNGTVPFIDLYDGPLWRHVRGHYPSESIAVLSAEHGVLLPNTKIEYYNRVMDEERLLEIVNDPQQVAIFKAMIEQAGDVVVMGGELYKLFALSVVAKYPELINKVHFGSGSFLQQRKAFNALMGAVDKYKSRTILHREVNANMEHGYETSAV